MRSICRRSIITMSAPFSPSRMSVKISTPKRAASAGSKRARRDQAHPRAHLATAGECWSAPRGCAARRRRSPRSALRSCCARRRMVSASSRAWVGCSWLPSPAFTTQQSSLRASISDRAGILVAHDEDVRPHRVERGGRVDQRLALGDRGGAHRHVHHVGAQPLARQLERALRAGGGLEEQIDDRAALEQGRLLLLGAAQGDIFVAPDRASAVISPTERPSIPSRWLVLRMVVRRWPGSSKPGL